MYYDKLVSQIALEIFLEKFKNGDNPKCKKELINWII